MIDLGTGFKVLTPLPVDERMVLTTEEMLNMNDNIMPDVYIATNKDDGQLYLYNKTNDIDAETGKFRLMKSEGGDIEQFIGTTEEWEALPAADKEKYDGKEVIITDDYEGNAEDTIELQNLVVSGTVQTTAESSNSFIFPFAYSHLYNFTVTQILIRMGPEDTQNWNMEVIPYIGYKFARTGPIISKHGQYIISGTLTKK